MVAGMGKGASGVDEGQRDEPPMVATVFTQGVVPIVSVWIDVARMASSTTSTSRP